MTVREKSRPKRRKPHVKPLSEDPPAAVEEQVIDTDDSGETLPFVYSITSWGADFPVDGLVQRLQTGDIVIPTFGVHDRNAFSVEPFQREYVWPRKKADLFIDSLMLGLPVPGIFLVKEPDGRLLVLDGHQRLFTLRSFYSGVIDGKEYRLDHGQSRFRGKRYTDLEPKDRRCLDDSLIHATIMRQDDPSDDQSSIYTIFERLNTGGVQLQPQEIRVALYRGSLARLLAELNDSVSWRELFGQKSRRLKDMEMILRFFALLDGSDRYESPMKAFLNSYMGKNRDLEKGAVGEKRELFQRTTSTILEALGQKAFRPQRAVNAAVVDALMVGVAKRLRNGKLPPDLRALQMASERLMKNTEFQEAFATGTSQEAKVKKRLQLATTAFAAPK